jgi:hypothetical protein
MFETIESRPSRIVLYFVQLLAVPIVVGILSMPVFALYDRLTKSLPGASAGVWDVAGLILLFGIGVVLGRFVSCYWDSLAPSGVWVWVPLACLSIWDFVGDWLNPYEHAEAFSIAFRSVGGHEGMVRFIGTDPAFSLMGYSLGLYLTRRRRKRPGRSAASPMQTNPS